METVRNSADIISASHVCKIVNIVFIHYDKFKNSSRQRVSKGIAGNCPV
jgi:hypothetical protein